MAGREPLMARRERLMLMGGLIGGILVGVIAGAALFETDLFGNTTTRVTLRPETGKDCVIGKETRIEVTQGKRLTWKISNQCAARQAVMVGNFRTEEDPGDLPADCRQATFGGAEYPFTESSEEARSRQVGTADSAPIKLKARSDLGEGERLYFFDICVNGAKQDPRLIVQR